MKKSEKVYSRLGFGTWGIGGDTGPLSGYGPTDDARSLESLEFAIDSGVTFIDTAPPYGNGHSEELIGGLDEERKSKAIILTKGGVETWADTPNYSAEFTRMSVRKSLERLKVGSLDYVIFHSLKTANYQELLPGYKELLSLRELGLIKGIGFSLKSPSEISKILEIFGDIDIVEVNFNALDTRLLNEEIQDYIYKTKLKIVARTPFCFGYLTDGIQIDTSFNSADHRTRFNLEQKKLWINGREKLREIIKESKIDAPIHISALAFCLSYDFISVVIPGMISKAEVESNLGALKISPLPKNVLIKIEELNKKIDFFVK